MSVKKEREEFIAMFMTRMGRIGNASRIAELAAMCVIAGIEMDRMHQDSWEIPWRRIIDHMNADKKAHERNTLL